MNEQEWVKRWEEREVGFRKVVDKAREGYDANIQSANERAKKAERTMHDQQAVILKVRSIPLIGNWIVNWAEKKALIQAGDITIYPGRKVEPWPTPTAKRKSGTRG